MHPNRFGFISRVLLIKTVIIQGEALREVTGQTLFSPSHLVHPHNLFNAPAKPLNWHQDAVGIGSFEENAKFENGLQ